jgi:excinuclease ABC subunit C
VEWLDAAVDSRTLLRQAGGVLPAEPGVYRFRDAAGRVIYLGRATDLRARVRSYAGDLVDRPHLRRMIPQVVGVEALACASVHEAAWLERNLLDRSLPRWNRVRGGAELVGWLVLDDNPARPGIALLVEPAEPPPSGFGPYLGVERLALARGALLRAWPLHLTGTRLDRADVALAEARGVTPADRDPHVRSLRALLARDPAAVLDLRARLEAASRDAVSRLAYETAQQIQAELAAIGWLVAPQRVTGCPDGLVVTGWAEGLGVTLRADGDRLDRWTSGPVGEGRGRAACALTPPAWQEFATRNAELAAQLRRLGSRPS